MNKNIGLIYNTEIMGNPPSYFLDTHSTESLGASWGDFGYEIIYRMEIQSENVSVINKLKEAFVKPFHLSNEHFSFELGFWRIYWDRGQWATSLLRECEARIDAAAVDNGIKIVLNGVTIQPRPMEYIHHSVH